MSRYATDPPDTSALGPGCEPLALWAGTLRELAGWRPEGGVLTVMAGAETGAADPAAAARIAVERDLRAVEEHLRETGPRERWVALGEARERSAEVVERMLAPGAPGRGRALLIPLDGSAAKAIVLQAALPSGAWLGRVTRILLLAESVWRGLPIALAAVARDSVELDLVGLGYAVRDGAWTLPPEEDAEAHRGPVAADPSRAQHAVTHEEREESHAEDRRRRFLAEVAAAVSARAMQVGWQTLVLTGAPGAAEPLAERLAVGGVPVALVAHVDVAGSAAHVQADALADEIDGLRARFVERRVEAVLAAVGQGKGAEGPGALPDALAEGRVAAVVLAQASDTPGYLTADGRLETIPLEEAEQVPSLLDEIAARALATGAQVIVVDGDVAAPVTARGGAVAELRW